MTLTILPDLEQGTPEWFDQRRGMVTASVVGKLISSRSMSAIEYLCPACEAPVGSPCLSKVKRGGQFGAPIKQPHTERTTLAHELRNDSPPILETATGDDAYNLTALLTAERITGYTEPTFTSDDMLRGHEDEPRAREKYAEHYAPVETVGFMVRDFIDFDVEQFKIGYSPDGLVGNDGLIEIKSRRQKKQLTTILADEVPPENMAQLQCGLLVSGRKWCDYISYSGGMHLWRKRVYPEAAWFEAILAAVDLFEQASAQMVARYNAATEGLPMTERVIETEMVINGVSV